MKKFFKITLVLALICGFCKAQDKTSDEAGVRKALEGFGKSWMNADFSDMGNYVTEDCNWINVVGMHWKGLKEVQYAHQVFSTMFKGVKAENLFTTIRFITKDVAIVYKSAHVGAFYPPDGVNRGFNKQGDSDDLLTIVLVKQKNVWKITSAENVTIVKQAQANNPVLKMK
ncbi:SgcJ/EcaC family oxidoreductase [Pedobacter paludis]|uniref:SnoaL-like domain-containing protein n=1 Tax=Pedobacter paludis TaxID=2203212 RepID=A0A317F6G9_9SPHI|nr:SgcJ/EcaC family oxidoreductase [Pedobacter paludis]PWS33146.1 hypothetical protein DF947_00475 [Pedobacter paludis]